MGPMIVPVLLFAIGLSVAACLPAEKRPQPMNRVVILLDASGSYRARQAAAMERTTALLEAMAEAKTHRWDKGTDRIVLISLDAVPEPIWEGTLQDLKAMDRTVWASRFQARTDYARCTDVDAAFRLAAEHLQGDSRYVRKYLFAFTDLIHEPPTDAIGRCRRPARASAPGEDFPWEAFRDVSVTVFWVPADQKLAWRRAVEAQGLSTFQLYAASESGAVSIAPPERPKLHLTEEDRAADQRRFADMAIQGLSWVAKLVLIGAGGLALGFVGLGLALRRRTRRPRPPQRPLNTGEKRT